MKRMIELSKYIVVTTNNSKRIYWTIINHEFYKWFNYLVKTYDVEQDYLADILYSRGIPIKRRLLVNKLIIILKTIGVDITTVRCITSGRVTVRIKKDELVIHLIHAPLETALKHMDSPITVNLIKFYKYQKNDSSTRKKRGH